MNILRKSVWLLPWIFPATLFYYGLAQLAHKDLLLILFTVALSFIFLRLSR